MWALTTLNGLGYGQVGPSYDSFRRINFVSSYHLQLRAPPPHSGKFCQKKRTILFIIIMVINFLTN